MKNTETRKRITLKDIADKTGYSVSAVSHALRDMPDISVEAKNYIKSCAAKLGYVGNASATSLRTGYSKCVAIIVGDLANPHFAFVAKEVEQTLSQSGYSTFIMSTNESKSDERKAILTACDRNVDGIILCPTQNPEGTENIDLITSLHIPCVLIGRHFENYAINSVISNDLQAGYLLAKHVLNMGHRKIAYLNTMYPNSSSRERMKGVLEAVNECKEHVEFTELFFEYKNHQFEHLMDQNGDFCFSALIAYNDLMAWLVINYIERLGKTVPEDFSLVGFDNLHSYLPLPFKLTSIAPPRHVMPRNAVKLLLAAIENPAAPPKKIVLDVELQNRGSVKQLIP